jgi:hypothetical protein
MVAAAARQAAVHVVVCGEGGRANECLRSVSKHTRKQTRDSIKLKASLSTC